MRGVWLFRLILFWFTLAVAAQAPAHAQSGIAGTPLGVCVLRDTGQTPDTLIRHPERFDCTTPQHRFGTGDYWVISRDIDRTASAADPLALRFGSLWQEGLTVRALTGDGRVHTLFGSDSRGITPLIQPGALAELTLPIGPAPTVRVLWHIRGAANVRGILVGARVLSEAESAHANLMMMTLYAGSAGLCIALIVYSFALWCAMRHPFQLHYCALLGLLLAYILSSSGAVAWLWPTMPNNDRLRLNYLFLAGVGGTGALFIRSFFEDRVFPRWLDRTMLYMAMAAPTAGLAVALFGSLNLRWADLLYSMAFIGLLATVLPTLWHAWTRRSHFLWLFALAWSAPLAFAAVRIVANLHGIGWAFWIDNSTVLSGVFEALTSALAVAYRIKVLRDERDDAIASEVMARRLADTDPLTGLLNRRAFLRHAIGRTGEQRLLIADLDHFKQVNETLGHDGGDEVLRTFSRLLRTCAPLEALVARMGGEEFAILVAADSSFEAEDILARLRATRMPFDMMVTASVGVCNGPLANEVDWKQLYRGADAALFEAKAAGRDRARTATRHAA